MSTSKINWTLSPGDLIRTFDFDENLPSLPLPALDKTIQRYLKSVKPFAKNEKEYENTKKIAFEFLDGIGAELNEKLLHHASKHKNWVEKWWEDYAYLSMREPLIPYYNMAGPHPSLPDFPYKPGQQIKIAAAYCHHIVQMWKLLREERLRPATMGNKQPLSMDQFRRVFNCSVIPGVKQDFIKSFFKTEKEGFCSSQIVVLCNGHMFLVDGVRPGGNPLTAVEWQNQLTLIKQKATPQRGSDVPCLAAGARNLWAQNRQHLVKISPVNAAIFNSLDSAMFVLCLDEANPDSEEVVGQLVLCGNYSCRWPDKATSIIVFNNGRVGGLCLHSPFDGIVSGIITLYTYAGVKESLNNTDSPIIQALVEPQYVNFILDQYINNEIRRTKTDIEIEKKKFIMCQKDFSSFGKRRMQRLKVHPDALIQMALQLAYYRLHSKFAPCYETATTRTFYHGRTETVRSCSEECVLWVRSMVNPHQKKASEQVKLLRKAIQTHNQLMKEAANGEGFDRHLFGLYCIAMENGLTIPQLFNDPLFSRSGGNGNFVLSTSLLGYSPLRGGVSPMCLHGYGIFYSILPESVLFTLTARTDSTETNPDRMLKSIMSSLQDAASLLGAEPTAKL